MAQSRVLVADDCRVITVLVRYILSKEGITSDHACTGHEALTKVLDGDYKLVFLDIVMPGMHGIEVAKKIHQQCGEAAPEIILMTAMGEDFQAEMLSESKASEVIFKPISPSKIVKVARRVLADHVEHD